MKTPMKDVLVVVPGIMGSTLYRGDTPLWDVTKGRIASALSSWGRSSKALRLPTGIGDEPADDGVVPKALFPDPRLPLGIWTFDWGYTRLVQHLKNTFEVNDDLQKGPCNLVAFPYDWRLSNRYNGAQLKLVAERALSRWRGRGVEYADSKLVFICHSMGGLVTRWYVDCLGGSSVTRTMITCGTPHRGALQAVHDLSNVARLGHPKLGLNLTNLARSLPSTYQLLPAYACIEVKGQLKALSDVEIPNLDTARVRDAAHFHAQLDEARTTSKSSYNLCVIGGIKQPTLTTAKLHGTEVEFFREINGSNEYGDATVPRLSIAPRDVNPGDGSIHYVADNHTGLVHNQALFEQVTGTISARSTIHLSRLGSIGVDIPDILQAGTPLVVDATTDDGDTPLELVLAAESGQDLGPPLRMRRNRSAEKLTATIPALEPGVYRVTVRGVQPYGAAVSPVRCAVLVCPTEGAFDADVPDE